MWKTASTGRDGIEREGASGSFTAFSENSVSCWSYELHGYMHLLKLIVTLAFHCMKITPQEQTNTQNKEFIAPKNDKYELLKNQTISRLD